jgi:hypothetical protein
MIKGVVVDGVRTDREKLEGVYVHICLQRRWIEEYGRGGGPPSNYLNTRF